MWSPGGGEGLDGTILPPGVPVQSLEPEAGICKLAELTNQGEAEF